MQINQYLSLRLENDETVIYVDGKRFKQCKYLQLTISVDEMTEIEDLRSIDEISDTLDHSLEPNPFNEQRRKEEPLIDPQTEFWGHCSNLQVWFENKYNTNLLHSNLAFPLLKELTDAGDALAHKVFAEEIGKRIDSGYLPVIFYLIKNGYILYLNQEEMDSLKFFRKIEEYAGKNKYSEPTKQNLLDGLAHYLDELKPKTTMEWITKAQFYKILRDPHKVLSIFEEGLKKFPDSEKLVMAYLYELHMTRNWARGIPYYKKILKEKDDVSDVWNIYGSLHEKSGMLKESIKYFKKAIELDPKYILPRLNLIRVYNELGYRKARDDLLEKVIKMDTKDEKMLENIGQVCHEAERYDLEIIALKKILFLNPENSLVWFVLSEIYLNLNKALHRKRCLKKVIMLDNDPVVTSSALTAMAIVFLDERGDIERSIKYLDRAVESNPDNHNAWFNLIPVLASKFDLERADLVKQIAMLLREKERLNFDPFNHQLIRLNQEITSLIKKYHEIGYRCPACKKKQDIAKFCRYCGSKLGISKDDMNKDIDLKSELQKRKSDPIFSQIRSFTKSDLLKILSKQKWKPFTKICLELNVKSEKDIKDLMDLVQSLVIERKIVQNFKGAVLELKKI